MNEFLFPFIVLPLGVSILTGAVSFLQSFIRVSSCILTPSQHIFFQLIQLMAFNQSWSKVPAMPTVPRQVFPPRYTPMSPMAVTPHPTKNSSLGDSLPSTYYYYGDVTVTLMSVLLLVFLLLAVLGNAMVVLTVVRHRGMRTRTNMFIVNLAVADILVAVLDMPVSLATLLRGDWILGRGFCLFNGFTMALLLMCSIHTLMYMSVHKYVSITRPFSRAMTRRRILLLIGAAWLWPCFCALTPFFGLTELVYKKGASQCGPAYPRSLKMYAHSALITVTNYFIPLGVMAFCYFNIFRSIAEHMSRVKATSNIGLHNSVAQQKAF